LALVEVSVVEQRYRVVLAVQAGDSVTAVAVRAGGIAANGARLVGLSSAPGSKDGALAG
jgi:hypothetical protein